MKRPKCTISKFLTKVFDFLSRHFTPCVNYWLCTYLRLRGQSLKNHQSDRVTCLSFSDKLLIGKIRYHSPTSWGEVLLHGWPPVWLDWIRPNKKECRYTQCYSNRRFAIPGVWANTGAQLKYRFFPSSDLMSALKMELFSWKNLSALMCMTSLDGKNWFFSWALGPGNSKPWVHLSSKDTEYKSNWRSVFALYP